MNERTHFFIKLYLSHFILESVAKGLMLVMLYTHNHNNTIIKTQEDFINKIFTSHFIARVRKSLLKGCVWERAGDRTELKYCDPTLMAVNVIFLVLLMLNRRPWGPLCWVLAFFTASSHLLWSSNPIGVPEGPLGRVWLSLPHSSITPSPTVPETALTPVLTELYNSSTSTRSPTRSLKSHVWSSSSGNNCHAVHRSFSSGASVYECTMGIFFSSSHFISQFPPTRFPLITAIRMCHILPVHHLGMAFLAGSKAKIQQLCVRGELETGTDCNILTQSSSRVHSSTLSHLDWPAH